MKEKVILLFLCCAKGAPFENPLRNILNPFQLGQDTSTSRNYNLLKRNSYNWRVNSYQDLTPGLDNDQAPPWALNNQYYPPKTPYASQSNIKSKHDGVFDFLPDISLPNFDKLFSDLHVKRNDVENALQELIEVPSFNSVAESVQNYFESGKEGIDDRVKEGLNVLFKEASDRQDVSRQGVDNRAIQVGTVLLLSLLTGGTVGSIITNVGRNLGNDEADDTNIENGNDSNMECGYYYGEDGEYYPQYYEGGINPLPFHYHGPCPPNYDFDYFPYNYGAGGGGNDGGENSGGGNDGTGNGGGGNGGGGNGDGGNGGGGNGGGGGSGGTEININGGGGNNGGSNGAPAVTVTVGDVSIVVGGGGGGVMVDASSGGDGGGGDNGGGGGNGNGGNGSEGDSSGDDGGNDDDNGGAAGNGQGDGEGNENGHGEDDNGDDDCKRRTFGGGNEENDECEESRGIVDVVLKHIAGTGEALAGGVRNGLVGGLNGLRRIVKTS